MDDFFNKLQDESYFCSFVTSHFDAVPEQMAEILECTVTVDQELVRFAHQEYLRNIDRFAVKLDSANPDHYKRAGSLLHALYIARPMSVSFPNSIDDVENGFGPVHVHYADLEGVDFDFARFYEEYHNEIGAFIFAFQCCASYEPDQRDYDLPFLQTMCVYMGGNTNLSLETFFMLFKSLMHR